MNKKLIWGIIIVLVIAGAGYFYWMNQKAADTTQPVASVTPSVSPSVLATTTPEVKAPVQTTVAKPAQTTTSTPAPVKGGVDTSTWRTYSDADMKIAIKYPADWSKSATESYPHSFWVYKSVAAGETSIIRYAQVDGCAPNKEILVDGMKAYDSGWRSSPQQVRTVCIAEKKYLIDMTAQNDESRVIEDAIFSSTKFTN